MRDPHDPRGADRPARFWATPGGGVEVGERVEVAARRELLEETELIAPALGAPLFERKVLLLVNNEPDLSQEYYFLIHVAAADISLQGLTPLEQTAYRNHHRWTMDDLEQTKDDVIPERLAAIIRRAEAQE